MPLSLTDSQLAAVTEAAAMCLRPTDGEFLDVLARALSRHGVAVGRAALAVGRPMLATNEAHRSRVNPELSPDYASL